MGEDQPCERCVQRNFQCIKTWGPKRTANELIPIESLPNTPVAHSLPAAIPFCQRDVDQRFLPYFQKQYRYTVGPSLSAAFLRHMSRNYNPLFSGAGDILPLAIAIEALPLGCLSTIRWNSSPERILFYEWLSRFHYLMGEHLEHLNIDESHLFAIFYVLLAHNFVTTQNLKTKVTYAVGFVRIMHFLHSSFLSETNAKSGFPSAIWPWMVTYVRLILSCWPGKAPNQIEDSIIDLWWDLSIFYGIVGSIENCLIEHPLQAYRYDYQCADIHASLRACLLVYLRSRRFGKHLTVERKLEVHHSMQNLRVGVEKFRRNTKSVWLMDIMVLKSLKLTY